MQTLSFLLYPFHKVNRTFQTLFLYLRPTWIEWAHGGVDPIFQRALDTCVPLTMEHNLAVIATIEEPKNLADSVLNYLVLLTQLRTRRLVRFTQYHSDELNKGHKRSLKKIYKHIGEALTFKKTLNRHGAIVAIHAIYLQFDNFPLLIHELMWFYRFL